MPTTTTGCPPSPPNPLSPDSPGGPTNPNGARPVAKPRGGGSTGGVPGLGTSGGVEGWSTLPSTLCAAGTRERNAWYPGNSFAKPTCLSRFSEHPGKLSPPQLQWRGTRPVGVNHLLRRP